MNIKYSVLFIFLFVIIKLSAQVPQYHQSNEKGNNIINFYGLSKQDKSKLINLENVLKLLRLDIQRMDSLYREEIRSMNREIQRKDSLNQMKELEIKQEIRYKDSVYRLQKEQYESEIAELTRQKKHILSKLIHPYFIRSVVIKKSTWRWVCNGVGVVSLANGIGFSIAARHNYSKHTDQIAATKTKHRDYYDNYRNYRRVAMGSFAVAGAAFLSNILCSPVKDVIQVSPATSVCLQGSTQLGVLVSIKF